MGFIIASSYIHANCDLKILTTGKELLLKSGKASSAAWGDVHWCSSSRQTQLVEDKGGGMHSSSLRSQVDTISGVRQHKYGGHIPSAPFLTEHTPEGNVC